MRTLLRPPVLALSAIVVAALLLARTAPVVESNASIALVLCLFSIGLWATGVLAEYLVALIFFTLVMLTRLVPADIAFAGFLSSAVWLIFAGIFIGMAVNQTGLGDRLAHHMAARLGRQYWQQVLGLVLFGIFMSFIMPSAMGRIVMMLPLLVALATRLGFPAGSKAHTGLLLAGVLGTYMPAFAILPANVPNMVLAGTLEALQNRAPVFGGYLLLHFPVLGAAKSVLLVTLLTMLFRDRPQTPAAGAADEPLPPMRSAEKRLTVLLIAALAMWLTDFLHNISPAWIAMVVAILLLLPKNGMLPPKSFPKANLAPVIYVAGIISLGAVVNATGIGKLTADMFLSFLPLQTANDFSTFGILSAVSALVGLVTTLPGVPAVLTPLSESFATTSGFSLNAVFMTQVVGFSTVILPYQSPPLIVAMQTASISFKDMTRVCLAMAALTVLLLWPLDYLWWQILGLV